jgi:hypothetical protein
LRKSIVSRSVVDIAAYRERLSRAYNGARAPKACIQRTDVATIKGLSSKKLFVYGIYDESKICDNCDWRPQWINKS